jgi:TolA-binding protein
MRKRSEIITASLERWIGLTIFVALLSNHFLLAESSGLEGKTLHSLLSISSQALDNGDYAYASEIYDALEREFGEDAEYSGDSFQRVILPIRGYTQLMSGQPEEAIDTLNEFLIKYPTPDRTWGFTFFTLGRAYENANKLQDAMAIYRQFEQLYTGKTEVAFAILRRAEILFKLEDQLGSIQLLNTFYASDAAYTLRIQARLRALQHCLTIDDREAAKLILFHTEWSISTMPELAVLSFSALRMGDILLDANDYKSALRCYRLALPKTVLVEAQENRLREIRAVYQKKAPLVAQSSDHIWADYYRQLISRIESQLEHLKNTEDYTSGFYLRYGQALLLANRPREAWTVFDSVASEEDFDEETRATAHYRSIVAAGALKYWDNALQLAHQFTETYPHSPLIPQAFYLIAEAYQGLHDYQAAIKILTSLIKKYPAHPLNPRWQFNRGFCHLLDERFANARKDFKRLLDTYPSGALTINACFWHAQCQFFEKKYPLALKEFDDLVTTVKRHPLTPEISYRRASTLYAMRNYTQALTEINRFLTEYFQHQRYDEAQVLKGDILMGKGDLLAAKKVFTELTTESGNLFLYAVFQVGKIYRALEDYEGMVKHFKIYLGHDDLVTKQRVSEALYWIGWAYAQQDNIEQSFHIFINELQDYGNIPETNEVMLILKTLDDLYAQYRQRGNVKQLKDHPLLTAINFETWLLTESEKAFTTKIFTYFSRINLYIADRLKKQNRREEAHALLVEIINNVPLEYLDAEGLGETGLIMEQQGNPLAAERFEMLLNKFPAHPQRASAYYGFAKLALENKDYSKTLSYIEKLAHELPGHPLATESTLILGKTLIKLDRADEAITHYEDLLRLKSTRGRIHARALQGLAQSQLALGAQSKAVAYYQRIYTLYRAYPELVTDAYLKSAKIFEAMGDLQSAYNTLDEMLNSAELIALDNLPQAQVEHNRLAALLPADKIQRMGSEMLP